MWKWLVPINVVLGGLDFLYFKFIFVGWTQKINDSELSGLSFTVISVCSHLIDSFIFYGLYCLDDLYKRETKIEREQTKFIIRKRFQRKKPNR